MEQQIYLKREKGKRNKKKKKEEKQRDGIFKNQTDDGIVLGVKTMNIKHG